MSQDDKDLEIARLRGKIEALEGELAKERAMRLPMPSIVPWFPPYELPPSPLDHFTTCRNW